jgi:hypothetical protein
MRWGTFSSVSGFKLANVIAKMRSAAGPMPPGAAEPATRQMLYVYDAWLFMERRLLLMERFPDPELRAFVESQPALSLPTDRFFFGSGEKKASPSTRAALVLSAVGCGWRAEEG